MYGLGKEIRLQSLCVALNIINQLISTENDRLDLAFVIED